MTRGRLVSLATALAAAGLFLFGASAGVASPNCDGPDPAPICDGETEGGEPLGALDATTYAWGWNTGSAQHTIVVRGWAIDPDTSGAIDVRLDVAAYSGSASVTATADLDEHGFEVVFPMAWEDALYGSLCVTALNVGAGVDTVLGCDSWVNN